jgi:hypothetical protein
MSVIMYDKRIVVIETSPTSKIFKQVTCLMTDEELAEAKLERPDLIFRLKEDLQPEKEPEIVIDESKGISIKGMSLPYNIEDKLKEILK